MMLKKTVIMAGLVVALSALLALWLFDKLMVLSGHAGSRQFFPRTSSPVESTQAPLSFPALRRSA